jgi:hypothetical protein
MPVRLRPGAEVLRINQRDVRTKKADILDFDSELAVRIWWEGDFSFDFRSPFCQSPGSRKPAVGINCVETSLSGSSANTSRFTVRGYRGSNR